MKKLVMLVFSAALALSGCATSGFLGFLATTQYVDLKAKGIQDQQAAEIAALNRQLADYQSVKDQAKAAVDRANKYYGKNASKEYSRRASPRSRKT